MKRTLNLSIYMLSVMLLSALCCGCHKDETASFRIGMEHFGGINGQKVYLADKLPHFELNDSLRLNGGTYVVSGFANDTWALVDWVGGTDAGLKPYYGAYPASAVTGTLDGSSTVSFTLPQKQRYHTVNGYQKLDAPMYAVAQTNQITFHNVCSVMEVRIINNTGDTRYIDSIKVSADNVQLCGSMNLTVTDRYGSLVAGRPDAGNNEVLLYGMGGTGGQRLDVNATASYYIYLPTYSGAKLSVYVFENSHGIKYRSDTLVQKVEGNLVRNKVFTVPFELNKENMNGFTPVTGGNGFTVRLNSDGTSAGRVYFAYGNLFYNKQTEKWYNASYQFNLLAQAGTSGADGIDQFCYSQGITNNYGVEATVEKPTRAAFADWGQKIDPSGNTWRTLSGEEWKVLVFNRPNAADLFGYAMISDIPGTLNNGKTTQNGCIFLPDDWVMPQAVLTSHGKDFVGSSTTFATNSYTYEEWLLLEEAGAIFLPYKALPKKPDDPDSEGDRISYWASGYNGDPLYSFCFHTTSLGGIHDHGTDPMYVRLVVNAELIDIK